MFVNATTIEYFIIKGISDVPEIQIVIFVVVLLIYLITLIGNMVILILVCVDSHLHSPMYFFLANLSIVDMASTSASLHKILIGFITGDRTVSFHGCMAQSFMSGSFTVHELFILAAMSYDRYVAVCRPLSYHLVMDHRTCVVLAFSCWTLGFLFVSPLVGILSTFSCYTSIEINHFLCDIVPLLNITCSDTSILDVIFFIEGLFLFTIAPFLFTFVPYVFIIVAILKIRTSTGRRKAFYTCSSHLTVVLLLYTLLITQYLVPSSSGNFDSKKLYALFNMAAVPLLNPLIYSFKNKDVKAALRRRLGRTL